MTDLVLHHALDLEPLFQKAKGSLFFKMGAGFLGPLLCKLGFKWTTEIDTAAISATTLYWNPDFFMSLDKETRITVLAHELWHNALMHGARLGNRCPDIWNIAGDHVINLLLKQHGFYMGGFPYIMDDKYIGWSTDQVYDDLIAEGKPMPQNMLGLDVKPISDEEMNVAIGNVVAAMTTAGMTAKAIGEVPAELSMIVDEFLNPVLPWEVLLYNFFNELSEDDYSYARPNRRYDDFVLPSLVGRNGLEHLIYYLDISGSILDEHIVRFNSEVKFIKEELKPERLTLVTFDTVIHEEYVFERDDPFEKIVVTGRGGTDLKDVFEHARKNDPTAIVIFTDMCVTIPENPGVPIIWACIDNPKMRAPYGQLVHIPKELAA